MPQSMNFSNYLRNTFTTYGTEVIIMKVKNNDLMVQYGKKRWSHKDGTLFVSDVTYAIQELLTIALKQGVFDENHKTTIELVPNIPDNEVEIRIIYNAPDMFDTLTLEQKAKGTLKGIRAAKRADRLAKIVKWFDQ